MNLKIAAIIAEYNPLHNGHSYHIAKTRELTQCDFLIIIMSGNFVERGEAAIIDKYERACTAIACGADIVIELPTLYSTSSAKYFAHGAISTIANIDNVEYLSFGSECGDTAILQDAINLIDSTEDYNRAMQFYLSQGLSYAVSAEKAFAEISNGKDNPLLLPNNVLATEYLRSIHAIAPKIKPITVMRNNDYHSENLHTICSATAIRKALENGSSIKNSVPQASYDSICNRPTIDYNKVFAIIADRLLHGIDKVYEDGEGIINRINKMLPISNDYNSLVVNSHTKRYSMSRIKRVMMHVLLNHNENMKNLPCSSVNVLAIKKNALHVLSNIKNLNADTILSQNDSFANKIYGIISGRYIKEYMRIIN